MAGTLAKRASDRAIFKLLLPLSHSTRTLTRSKYYILLPEIPRDTPETNPLLQDQSFSDFTSLTRDNCIKAAVKLAFAYEYGIRKLAEDLQNGSVEKTFSAVVEPIEEVCSPLVFAWNSLTTLSMVNNSLKLHSAVDTLSTTIQRVMTRKFVSLPIYHAFKEINADHERLDMVQQQLVRNHLLLSKLYGVDLSDSENDKYNSWNNDLKKHLNKFSGVVELQSNKFQHTISNESLVKNFPEELRELTAQSRHNPSEGPWTITLYPRVYNLFMEYCSDRTERWNIWNANVSRAGLGNSNDTNSICIEDIRQVRGNIANVLGYSTFAEMTIETKMARSISNVEGMLKTIHAKSKPILEDQLLTLQEFALQHNFKEQLEIWDIPYWRRVYRDEKFKVDDLEASRYFLLPLVLESMFAFCEKVFGIVIKKSTDNLKYWSEDVDSYSVFDNGELQGSFCIDLYSRPGLKMPVSTFLSLRYRNETAGVYPSCSLVLNLPREVAGQPIHLSFSDVVKLYRIFGSVLQHTLNISPYSMLTETNYNKSDITTTNSHFMTYWLYHYTTFSSIFKHSKTGEPMPQEMHANLVKNHRHMAIYDLNKEVYLSTLDLELHSKKDFWHDITKNVWAEHMPFKLGRDDSHPCSFTDIFSERLPAAYFSDIWAQMLAADYFSAFLEVGLDKEDKVCELGQRYKNTFLSLGMCGLATESFRRFRGRDPSVEALLMMHGADKHK